MIYTYETYREKNGALSFDEMRRIHDQIIYGVEDDPEAGTLYTELLLASVRYIDIRANWPLWSKEERHEKGDLRTSCHDAVISRLNALAGWMEQNGKNTAWREELGDEVENRKCFGDFGCYLAFVNSVNAR